MARTVLVFAGGLALTPLQAERLPEASVVIGADSGVDRARDVGRVVDIAVGDFDSVSAEGLTAVHAGGGAVHRFPESKDETDLELALLHAIELGAEKIWVSALDGGRIDHFLANLLLLADQRFESALIDADVGDSMYSVIHRRRQFEVTPGDGLSILPIGGDATGVETTGLLFPLSGETLPAGSPRGMSNVATDAVVSVSVAGGTVVVIS